MKNRKSFFTPPDLNSHHEEKVQIDESNPLALNTKKKLIWLIILDLEVIKAWLTNSENSLIILQHPEYHQVLADPSTNLEKDYWPEFGATNPFLHMALYQAIYEQISTNRPDHPAGNLIIYKKLYEASGGPHLIEHKMIEILTDVLGKIQ